MFKSPAKPSTKQKKPGMPRDSRLLLLSALQFLSFALLARWVRHHPINRLDVQITHQAQKNDSRLLQILARCLTLLCAWQLVTLVTVALALRWWRARRRLEAVLLVSLAMSNSVNRNRNHKGDGAHAHHAQHLARLRLCRDYFRSLFVVF